MGASKNNGTPKSSILIGFSIIFTIHFGGKIPLFLVQHPYVSKSFYISTSCQLGKGCGAKSSSHPVPKRKRVFSVFQPSEFSGGEKIAVTVVSGSRVHNFEKQRQGLQKHLETHLIFYMQKTKPTMVSTALEKTTGPEMPSNRPQERC